MTTTRTPMEIALTATSREVIAALIAAGGRPYLVGGCVRDAVLNPDRAPQDIDIEVYDLETDAVLAALRPLGAIDETGKQFSVLKMRRRGEDFDIALPRREVKSGPGHRGFDIVIDPHSTLESATARRELTFNALMYDPQTRHVIDCWGGLDDLAEGVMRHVSPAFTEDPLRVLRAVAFSARFATRLAPETLALCRELVPTFSELPVERVWGVWHKIATEGTHLRVALETLTQTGWDAHFPQLAALHGIEQDVRWHPEGDVFVHSALAAEKAAELADEAALTGNDRAVVVLAALCHDFGKVTHTQIHHGSDETTITSIGHEEAGVAPTLAFLEAIGAPKDIRARIAPLVREHMAATNKRATRPAVRRLARRLGPATTTEWALVVAADKGSRGEASRDPELTQWLILAALLGTQKSATPRILRGEHLMARGMQPGLAFGPILSASLDAQDNGEFVDEEGALAWLAQHLEDISAATA